MTDQPQDQQAPLADVVARLGRLEGSEPDLAGDLDELTGVHEQLASELRDAEQ